MGKKSKQKWKPVALESFTSPLDFDGLVGIEELSEYSVENRRALKGKINKKKKRKVNDVEGDIPFKKKRKETSEEFVMNDKMDKNEQVIHKGKVTSQKKKKQKEVNVKETKVKKEPFEFEVLTEQEYFDRVPHGMEAWGCCHVPIPVIKALQDLGYDKPTEIQSLTLPAAIKGRRDILGAAETGSGKTLAFGIPIIHGILMQKRKVAELATEGKFEETEEAASEDEDENFIDEDPELDEDILPTSPRKRLYALILTPTRELAIQVRNHLIAAAKYTDIKIATVLGGMAQQKQERLLNRGPEIVVATPGRLWEMIQVNPHLQQVGDISFLAIDETDRMLEKGHFQELQQLLERININPEKKKKRQNFVFSATLTLVHEAPKYVNKGSKSVQRITPGQKMQDIISTLGITQPKIVDVTAEKGTARTLSEARIVCDFEEKDFYLSYFLQQHKGRTLVFCNSISCVRRLAQILGILECKPLPLHANMQQRQRLKNLENFRDREDGLLLATDVAARGLDIPDVEHVIHYQVPRTSEIYVHRSGRTARAKKEGLTLLIMEPAEIKCYLQLCKTLGRDRNLPDFPVDPSVLSIVKKKVVIARKLDQLTLQYKKKTAKANWFQRAAEEMDLILDEDDMPESYSPVESAQIKRQLKGLRWELQTLMDAKIFPKQLSFKYPTKYEQEKVPSTGKATEIIKNIKPGAFVKLHR